MKLIIAGSRTLDITTDFLHCLLHQEFLAHDNDVLIEVISGGCPTGPDKAAKDLCYAYIDLFYTEFHADWNLHGKAAGPIRNKQMAEYADSLLLIWDGESKGSLNMKNEMLKLKKPVFEIIMRKL